MSNYTEGLINKIEGRYNPESDLPGAYNNPIVSITEYELLEIIKELKERIEVLEDRAEQLEIRADKDLSDSFSWAISPHLEKLKGSEETAV